MKVYMVYTMPEDKEEYELVQNASNYNSLILHFINQMRRWDKADKQPDFEEAKEVFYELVQRYQYDY